jgi:hypothetical protein
MRRRNITVLTHYTSRLGIRSKDLEVIHEKQATLNMHLDEWGYKNMQLAFLGARVPAVRYFEGKLGDSRRLCADRVVMLGLYRLRRISGKASVPLRIRSSAGRALPSLPYSEVSPL